MQPTHTPQEFVNKWRQSEVKERSGYQEHFIDICRLIGHATPVEEDPSGTRFTYEAGATKQNGGQGWADVWYKGHFAWEYKGKHADLDKAYQQLLQYRESLENPPLLIVSDFERILIHTNFTNTVKRVETITLDDLLIPARLELLRAAFEDPEYFRAKKTTEQVTQDAAIEFSRLANLLRKYGENPQTAAHFLIRLLFCMFAEDVGLLPTKLFSQLVLHMQKRPDVFAQQLKQLFGAMAKGGAFGVETILHFNGGLFEDNTALSLDSDGMDVLARVCGLDWSSIEPSIFGTLFERGLDPSKRAQLGAHFTSKADILLIVEPVLMAPLRRKWVEVQAQARKLAAERDAVRGSKRDTLQKKLTKLLLDFAHEIASIRVLDPACGSGNFLYVSLRCLLDLEKEVITLAGNLSVGQFFPSVSPSQLYGIELNPYAHDLAQMTVWIGYIQWLRENGFGWPSEPILKPLHNIVQMDAILAFDTEDYPIEPEWPTADVIMGNPPFLGDKKMRAELGDNYVNALRNLYDGRLPGGVDLVCYWYEKARGQIEAGGAKRAGLLATNSIRDGANSTVLGRIKQSGDIFWAVSDREWVLDGAAVNVSMVAFDDGTEATHILDSATVLCINRNLTSATDISTALRLPENAGLCFLGVMKAGPFDIDTSTARMMLNAPLNPNGHTNSDVIKRRCGGQDITGRPSDGWIIDFNEMPLSRAAGYELPFEYVRTNIKPIRDASRDKWMRAKWWLHGRSRPEFRSAVAGLYRYIATVEVAKYRNFVWLDASILPDHTLHVITRDDDYFFGVLHSRVHEVWSLAIGSTLEDRPRYSSSRTFEPFPFPWPPNKEPQSDPRVQAIAQAAKELVEQRDRWLNPEGASEAELKKRTLTNLYNQRPTWLDLAHKKLDAAVFDAYGWPHDLSDDDILSRLLALNKERSATV